jgi:hypothetical protein
MTCENVFRNRIEEEMRENHPYFDRPLFLVGRDSQLRRFCQNLVYAKYTSDDTSGIAGGKTQKQQYKEIRYTAYSSRGLDVQCPNWPHALSRLADGSGDVVLVLFDAVRESLADDRRESRLQQRLSSGILFIFPRS